MQKKILVLSILLLTLSFFAIPNLTFAQGGGGNIDTGSGNNGGSIDTGGGADGGTLENRAGVKLKNSLEGSSIKSILQSITKFLTRIGGLIVTIMIIIGAFQMIFSGGKPEEFKKGRTTIVYAVIGLLIILVANGIMAVVSSVLATS